MPAVRGLTADRITVNPLNAAALAKGKSKDVHVENIECVQRSELFYISSDYDRHDASVNFGSNKILSNAKLDLAHGRRYGLIGRSVTENRRRMVLLKQSSSQERYRKVDIAPQLGSPRGEHTLNALVTWTLTREALQVPIPCVYPIGAPPVSS